MFYFVILNLLFFSQPGYPNRKNPNHSQTRPSVDALFSSLPPEMIPLVKDMKRSIDERLGRVSMVAIGKDSPNPGKIVNVGLSSYEENPQFQEANTQFDLASLTKPLATAPAVLHLIGRKAVIPGTDHNILQLSTRLSEIFPEWENAIYGNSPPCDESGEENKKDQVTVRDLLTHESGLKNFLTWNEKNSDLKKVQQFKTIKEQVQAWKEILFQQPIYSDRYGQYLYSDLNYMLLGLIVEKVSGQSLPNYLEKEIYSSVFDSDEFCATHTDCVPSLSFDASKGLSSRPDNKLLPNDPWAAAFYPHQTLGHAGLYGSVRQVSRLLHVFLNKGDWEGKSIIPGELVEQMLEPQGYTLKRTLGFDFSSPLAQRISGDFPENSTVSHSGFTGTSLVADYSRGIYVVLLTDRAGINKTYPRKQATKMNNYRGNVASKALPIATKMGEKKSGPSEYSRMGSQPDTAYYDLKIFVENFTKEKVRTKVDGTARKRPDKKRIRRRSKR